MYSVLTSVTYSTGSFPAIVCELTCHFLYSLQFECLKVGTSRLDCQVFLLTKPVHISWWLKSPTSMLKVMGKSVHQVCCLLGAKMTLYVSFKYRR